ncbi:hypothetical protein ACH44C_21545 [Streptomyces purpureus]|uniref:hypothetical protein n=1 Tax=Streptomyces purpureus TaxID=1951 RepID=UPI000364C046|nr:hypothetical protein [Streptomyces purpureus]
MAELRISTGAGMPDAIAAGPPEGRPALLHGFPPDGAGVATADPCVGRAGLPSGGTDLPALPAYATLGDSDCERLAELAGPFGRAVVEAGLIKLG